MLLKIGSIFLVFAINAGFEFGKYKRSLTGTTLTPKDELKLGLIRAVSVTYVGVLAII